MKESVIMFLLRDLFLVLNILHISPGLHTLQDTKYKNLKTTMVWDETPFRWRPPRPHRQRPLNSYWRPTTLHHQTLLKTENFSLETQSFYWSPQILFGDHKLFILDPRFLLKTPNFSSRTQIYWGSPESLLKIRRSCIDLK